MDGNPFERVSSLPSISSYKAQPWSWEAVERSGRNVLWDEQALGMQPPSPSWRASPVLQLLGGLTVAEGDRMQDLRFHWKSLQSGEEEPLSGSSEANLQLVN